MVDVGTRRRRGRLRTSRRDGFLVAKVEMEIRAFLEENFAFACDPDSLPGSVSLTRIGVVDSMGVLEVIMFLDERYGIDVADTEAVPANLDTVDNLVAFITRKTGGQDFNDGQSGPAAA